MKIIKVCSVLLLSILSVSSPLLARLSQRELIERRKESVNDWKAILAALRREGLSEKNRAYRRVQMALKRSESRLANLEKGEMPFSSPSMRQGRGFLEQLGLLTKEAQRTPETQARKTSQSKKASKQEVRKPVRKNEPSKRKNVSKKSSPQKRRRKSDATK